MAEQPQGSSSHGLWLSFGEPNSHIPIIRASGAVAICQVGSVQEAVAAVDAGTQCAAPFTTW